MILISSLSYSSGSYVTRCRIIKLPIVTVLNGIIGSDQIAMPADFLGAVAYSFLSTVILFCNIS